jgi:hypothetical protein
VIRAPRAARRRRTEPTDEERALLVAEGFRLADVPGQAREEWIDVGGQRMDWWRAVELARRDRAGKRPTTGKRRARVRRSQAGGSAS